VLDQVARTMEVLRGKWTVPILCALLDGPVRLNQLRRLIPTASKKAITANLRSLETVQLILRRDSVLHVEYEIAEAAREPLAALVNQLSQSQNFSARSNEGIAVPSLHFLSTMPASWKVLFFIESDSEPETVPLVSYLSFVPRRNSAAVDVRSAYSK
jgi:DNA-binding HxlR family transcriptional regulator